MNEINEFKKIEVFEGNKLTEPIILPSRPSNVNLVGIHNNAEITVPLSDDVLSKHLLLLGGIGTGKTNAFNQIISKLRRNITDNDVMIIFDTKGDFQRQFYQQGDIVISNDHSARGIYGVDYWNIFNEVENDEQIEENIIEIAKTLFHELLEKTNQPFFPNAAKDLFAAFMKLMKLELNATNQDIRTFYDSASSSDIRKILSSYPELKSLVSYIANDSTQTQGVLSELYQVIREIFIGNFKKPGTLSLRQLVRAKGGKVIFIEYDIGIGSMLAPIYSLMFDLAIKEALCRKKSEGNVYFIVDEFSLLPNLNHIDDAVNFGRSLGIKFMIGIQNIEQIYDAYGAQRARSILSGFLTSITFKVNDATSKNYIKELYGKNRKKETFMSKIQGRGIVENIREAYVVEDWDIANLEIGQAIIGFPNQQPFRFKFKKF